MKQAVAVARSTPKEDLGMSYFAQFKLKPTGSGDPLEQRMLLVHSGTIDLYVDILQDDGKTYKQVLTFMIWEQLKLFVNNDGGGEEEFVSPCPTSVCADMGLFVLASKHLEQFARSNAVVVDNILRFLRYCAANPHCAEAIYKANAHVQAVRWVATLPATDQAFDRSLIFLHRLSLWDRWRSKLRADGALDAVIPFLGHMAFNGNTDDGMLLRGYLAGSMVIRLAGNDENGVGPETLCNNPHIVRIQIIALESLVSNAGQVWGLLLSPAQITADLVNLACSDRNKALLKPAVSMLLAVLQQQQQQHDVQLVKDVLRILLLLTFDKSCLNDLKQQYSSGNVSALLHKLIDGGNSVYNLESKLMLQNLDNQLLAVTTPSKSAAAAPKKRGISSILGRTSSKPAVAAPAKKHVMLSYNWDVQPLVLEVNAMLHKRNIPTWIDVTDMGANLNDSMSSAVEHAACVFVFLTNKYKESGNCRKECEYAESCNVPIVYIMAQKGYMPQGWLGLLLGKSVYVPMWESQQVTQQIDKLVERARMHQSGKSALTTSRTTIVRVEEEDNGSIESLRNAFYEYKLQTDNRIAALERKLAEKY